MKDDIKNLIGRLRANVGAFIAKDKHLNIAELIVDCLNASYELEEAYSIIDKMSHEGMFKPSQRDVEPIMKSTEMWDEERQELVYIPQKELFEYYVVDALSGHRAIGVVQATDINEATEIMKNSIKPNHFCVTNVHKLEFNDKGFCDIYSGF